MLEDISSESDVELERELLRRYELEGETEAWRRLCETERLQSTRRKY